MKLGKTIIKYKYVIVLAFRGTFVCPHFQASLS